MIRSLRRPAPRLRAASWALCAALPCLAAPVHAASPPPAPPSAHKAATAGVTPLDLADARSYRLPGALRARDTLADLRTRFGKANVTVETLDGAEGETSPGVVLFADDPARRAELFMQDDTLRGIASVRVSGAASRWHLDNGIRPGLTLARLAAMNGKPVTFNGLDWDYGGTVTDWHGGALAPAKNPPVFVSVALTHAGNASGYPQGEGDYRSDSKRYPRQGTVLTVGQLMLTFPDP